jgi:predicted nucleic acid-binding protein
LSGVTLDTSVYIAARRRRQPDLVSSHRYGGELVFLSSVVAQELYAGTLRALWSQVDQLWRRFDQVGRLFVPTAADWRQAGLVLSQIGQQFGYDRIARRRLTNDALLAMSARSLGLTVLTMNARDFSLVAQYRSFEFRVVDPNRLRI